MTGDAIVRCARSWIGTPYHHQASTKGVGTDCLGLVRGIWRELYEGEPTQIPAYTADWSEPQRDETLWRAARRHLKELAQPQVGAVILFRMREGMVAKHLGVLSELGEAPSFVHAYARHGVIESALSVPWRRRAVSFFAFPE